MSMMSPGTMGMSSNMMTKNGVLAKVSTFLQPALFWQIFANGLITAYPCSDNNTASISTLQPFVLLQAKLTLPALLLCVTAQTCLCPAHCGASKTMPLHHFWTC